MEKARWDHGKGKGGKDFRLNRIPYCTSKKVNQPTVDMLKGK